MHEQVFYIEYVYLNRHCGMIKLIIVYLNYILYTTQICQTLKNLPTEILNLVSKMSEKLKI